MSTFIKKLQNIQRFVVLCLIMILPILVFIQVLLRYVFKAPLMGIEELMLFPTIWLYMLGGANASMERNHISCGVLTLYIKKEKTNNLFNLITSILSFVISTWLTFWAFKYFLYSLQVWKESNLLLIPMFFGESAVFLGLFIMTLYAFMDVKQNFMKLRTRYTAEEGLNVNNSNT
ncbi:TRAP-type C4-dicarboxylate transport system, small permease component [Thalassobacillus cyri]|uniref:TRAP-type C4-dicarboxylate transport system, small permease component n=1 Tax=Thalassobacillus cyri TaxID=571932 RepID=A0A1H3W001_9BACI|nr:TRAP transporter small permease subunit [Thalassobacillus cyri]SDZ80300.1 TRAP-type C4-dicarboxylate transport system, small permease component [Thalassobacillus cyri]